MQEDVPFLVFQLAQLGINTSVHKHDMCATAFIHKVSLKCLEFPGQSLYSLLSRLNNGVIGDSLRYSCWMSAHTEPTNKENICRHRGEEQKDRRC